MGYKLIEEFGSSLCSPDDAPTTGWTRGATGVELHVFNCMFKCSFLANVGSVYYARRVSLNYIQ